MVVVSYVYTLRFIQNINMLLWKNLHTETFHRSKRTFFIISMTITLKLFVQIQIEVLVNCDRTSQRNIHFLEVNKTFHNTILFKHN